MPFALRGGLPEDITSGFSQANPSQALFLLFSQRLLISNGPKNKAKIRYFFFSQRERRFNTRLLPRKIERSGSATLLVGNWAFQTIT